MKTFLLIASAAALLAQETKPDTRQLSEVEQLQLQNLQLQLQLIQLVQETRLKDLCHSVGAEYKKDCIITGNQVKKQPPATTESTKPNKEN